MNKFQLLLSSFLLIWGVLFGTESISKANLAQAVTPITSNKTIARSLPWEELYQRKPPPRRDPPAGSRGNICPIAPATPGEVRVIWSDRPLFLWMGNIGKIEVRPRGSQQALWSQTVQNAESAVMYSGEALQAGQSYDWVMLNPRGIPIYRITFQVMEKAERDRISADLTRLEAQGKQQGTTAEGIAYAKADYFASRQLWGDVLREAYAVNNASEGLTRFKQAVSQQFCSGSS